jgi:hypothetical protein
MLAACGGGGGSSADPAPIAVSLAPGSIEQGYLQHFDRIYADSTSPQPVTVTASFSSAPADVALVRLLGTEAVFGPDPIGFGPVSGSATKFAAVVTPDPMLAPGVHEGDVAIQLCKDLACSAVVPTSGATLHYKLTVRAGLKIALLVDGVEFTNPGGGVPGTSNTQTFPGMPSGGHAQFTSTVPVTWTVGGVVPGSVNLCEALDTVTIGRSGESPTALSISVSNASGQPCDLEVTGTPVDAALGAAAFGLHVTSD